VANIQRKIVEQLMTAGVGTSASLQVEVSKSVPWSVGQFRSALADCRATEQRGDDISRPLRTCLDALYELLGRLPALKQSAEVRALRFARARAVHQSASLTFRDGRGPSMWRQSSQLPKPKNMRQHWDGADAADFDRLLAGRPVTDALARLGEALARAGAVPLAA
jgi:hypothetical protein